MPELLDQSEARIAAKIPVEMRAALAAEAKRHGVSKSAVLRWALAAWLGLADSPSAPTQRAS